MAGARGEGDTGTVARVMRMLGYVARIENDFGIKDIAVALALPQSTVHRLLSILIEGGFVERGDSRRYRIGPQFLLLARMALRGNDVTAAALGPMRNVVDACGETCLLGLYHAHNHTMSFVARVDSQKPLRYRIRMHGAETLAWGASGRSILAFLPDAVVEEILARDERSPTSAQPLQPRVLRQELALIRSNGYALSHGQRIEGAAAISAPIFAKGSTMLGSLTVTIPSLRFRAKDENGIAVALMREASALSRMLGQEEVA